MKFFIFICLLSPLAQADGRILVGNVEGSEMPGKSGIELEEEAIRRALAKCAYGPNAEGTTVKIDLMGSQHFLNHARSDQNSDFLDAQAKVYCTPK